MTTSRRSELPRTRFKYPALTRTCASPDYSVGPISGAAIRCPDPTAYLYGIFTEMDTRKSIFTFDMAVVTSDNPRDLRRCPSGGSGFYWGGSATQRFGDIDTAFRVNTSTALDGRGLGGRQRGAVFG